MKKHDSLDGDTALYEQATLKLKQLEARAHQLRMMQAYAKTLAHVRELAEGRGRTEGKSSPQRHGGTEAEGGKKKAA